MDAMQELHLTDFRWVRLSRLPRNYVCTCFIFLNVNFFIILILFWLIKLLMLNFIKQTKPWPESAQISGLGLA